MDFVLNVVYLLFFSCMLVVNAKILLDSNFEKCFKQGRVNSIKIAYVIAILILSFLSTYAIKYVIDIIYELITL